MSYDKKMPYEAPGMVSVILAVENTICIASTGEKFSDPTNYDDGWYEED